MALHDPESSAKEKALALKLGRQKKIQIIDGQQVEVMGGFDDEDEDEPSFGMEGIEDGQAGEENIMAVQGDDGQHYVVLEVIQMEGEKEGEGAKVKVVSGGGGGPGGLEEGEDGVVTAAAAAD